MSNISKKYINQKLNEDGIPYLAMNVIKKSAENSTIKDKIYNKYHDKNGFLNSNVFKKSNGEPVDDTKVLEYLKNKKPTFSDVANSAVNSWFGGEGIEKATNAVGMKGINDKLNPGTKMAAYTVLPSVVLNKPARWIGRTAGGILGGALGGSGGATVGAVAGSEIPVAGNIAGGVAGGIIGRSIGAARGAAIGDTIGNVISTVGPSTINAGYGAYKELTGDKSKNRFEIEDLTDKLTKINNSSSNIKEIYYINEDENLSPEDAKKVAAMAADKANTEASTQQLTKDTNAAQETTMQSDLVKRIQAELADVSLTEEQSNKINELLNSGNMNDKLEIMKLITKIKSDAITKSNQKYQDFDKFTTNYIFNPLNAAWNNVKAHPYAYAGGAAALGGTYLLANKLNQIRKNRQYMKLGCESIVDHVEKQKCKNYVLQKTMSKLRSELNKCTNEQCKMAIQQQINNTLIQMGEN